jgi:hypothetical protein
MSIELVEIYIIYSEICSIGQFTYIKHNQNQIKLIFFSNYLLVSLSNVSSSLIRTEFSILFQKIRIYPHQYHKYL